MEAYRSPDEFHSPRNAGPVPDHQASDEVWLQWILRTAPQYGLKLKQKEDQNVAIAAAKIGLWPVEGRRL